MAELKVIVHHTIDLVFSDQSYDIIRSLFIGSETGTMDLHITLSNGAELLCQRFITISY